MTVGWDGRLGRSAGTVGWDGRLATVGWRRAAAACSTPGAMVIIGSVGHEGPREDDG
jgi:hypothetical protein